LEHPDPLEADSNLAAKLVIGQRRATVIGPIQRVPLTGRDLDRYQYRIDHVPFDIGKIPFRLRRSSETIKFVQVTD